VTVVLNVVLLSLAGLSILAALYFVLKGLGARSSITRQAYSVGQVEAKRTSQVNWIRAASFFLLGLIFLGIFAVRPLFSRLGASPAPTPTAAVEPVPTATESAPSEPTAQPSPTTLPATPTAEVTAAPTATTAPATATVSSGVGVWLRGAPSTSGEQLEWLLDGTIVTVLSGEETADELVWQQVRTAAGIEGWVARDFLIFAQPTP
jgi:hypothetical protein